MTDFTPINLPANDVLQPSELVIDGFTLSGFSQNDADQVVQVFQTSISEIWATQGGRFNQAANLHIEGLNFSLDPSDFETPDRLGRALASQLLREIF